MLVYKKNNKIYSYIHIPKNSGTFIRRELKKQFEIVQNCWHLTDRGKFDLAHVPFMLREKYIKNLSAISEFYTFTRNPYHRAISAFFWKHKNADKKNTEGFRRFIKEKLPAIEFSLDFRSDSVHYYPQYLFICDQNLNFTHQVSFEKLEQRFPKVREYDLSKFYDDETIQIVNQIYERDFKHFGYQMINPN